MIQNRVALRILQLLVKDQIIATNIIIFAVFRCEYRENYVHLQ